MTYGDAKAVENAAAAAANRKTRRAPPLAGTPSDLHSLLPPDGGSGGRASAATPLPRIPENPMPRESIAYASREAHTDDMPIDQRPMPANAAERGEGDVIEVDPHLANADYLAALAFMEEPVTIRLEPSSDPNAISRFVVWVNGKGAEVFQNGRWNEIAWLPIGEVITIKRKYLEVIVRAKIDTIRTPDMEALTDRPDNRARRHTSSVNTFSVIRDESPRGAAWLTEMMRRNF